jgi:hypothetical protein
MTVDDVIIVRVLPYSCRRLQQTFIATSRELKRLDSVAFSPIFSHFGETLSGLTTVRGMLMPGFLCRLSGL